MRKLAVSAVLASVLLVGCTRQEHEITVAGTLDPTAPIAADWTVQFRPEATNEAISTFMGNLSSLDNKASRAMAEAKADYETRTVQVRLVEDATPRQISDLRSAFESSGLVEAVKDQR